MQTNKYFKHIEKKTLEVYEIAKKARKKGLDPVKEVEIPLAMSMAEKVVGLISTIYPQMKDSKIADRILELEKEYGKLDSMVIFKIAEEVAKQKFCKFSSILESIDAGIRISFAYTTLGVVSSPIEGFTEIRLGKTREGKDYFKAYFSGPIRSAGTTASCIVLMVIDYLRELFGYAKYDARDDEIKRYVSENTDYHERITNLQYFPTEEEIIFLAKNLPIQICGEPTHKLEVSNYKNLERVETNYIRGGMCLIFSEGLAQKAAKGFRLLNAAKKNGINSTGWDFLEDYIELHEKRNIGKSSSEAPTYIKDLVAGRPIYGHPSRSGAFRFRYGRGRTSGFSAASVHPATMAITDDFIAIGTQLKIEKPTKGCAITSCDSIDGPIVKLNNGSVKKLKNQKEAKKLYPDIEEIIYLGDILFPFSDVLNRNSVLIKPGYVEEWWHLDLSEKSPEFSKQINPLEININEAIEISKKYFVPLHPNYIYYWKEISKEQFLGLINWIKNSSVKEKKLIFPYKKDEQEKFSLGKRALELLGVEHDVFIENVIVDKENTKSLFANLGIDLNLLNTNVFLEKVLDRDFSSVGNDILNFINSISEFNIKDKSGEFIGARMGRPEKAKLRKLTGSPNTLFPVGSEGGRLRSLQAACSVGRVKSVFPLTFCKKCNRESVYNVCEDCGEETLKMYFYESGEKGFVRKREHSEKEGTPFCIQNLDINHYFSKALKKINLEFDKSPVLIKGIRGTSSKNHVIENLSKGILRARFNLQVNKDGTIRMDATEIPITHFKPKEIGVSIKDLINLGYDYDIYGNYLRDEEQILEIMPHDILIPDCPVSPDEKGGDVFIRIANFIDAELESFYGLKSFYNVKKKEDLIGHFAVCMAPHNCAGVISRIIGFSNTQGLLASPYMHAAIRRDCFDYDIYIPIKEKSFWKNVKIGEFVEKLNPSEVIDSFGTREKKVNNFKTISFEKYLKESKINNFTKHFKTKMFEIKTSLGKKLRVSENHKFLIDGKEKDALNIKLGDKLPLPRKIKIPSRNLREINLIDFLKDENLMVRKINSILKNSDVKKAVLKSDISKKQFQNFKLRDSYPLKFILNLTGEIQEKIFETGKLAAKRDSVETPIKIKLSKELLEVIGLYIAEGYSRSVNSKKGLNQVYISSEDKNLRNFVEKTIENSFGLIKTENKKDRVTFSSRVLYLFFTKILEAGSIAREKRIPYLFLNLPLANLACVLRGYFEGDGSVSSGDKRVCCDSVSEGLLNDLEFCFARFGIFAKRYEYEKKPGPKLRNFYIKKNRMIPLFKITKLIIGSNFITDFKKIGFLSDRKNKIFKGFFMKKFGKKMRIDYDSNFVYDPIISIKYIGEKESYCLNVNTKSHLVIGNSIVSKQCDGDEAALMLLGDVLLNFSREFLPSHRGGTQDAPLVLNAKIDAGEVDDQILDLEFVPEGHYPLELYRCAEQKKHSSEIKSINTCKNVLKEKKDLFVGLGFTHNTNNFNDGVLCSSYKTLITMQEKVQHQMELVEKIRAVDTSDTARLIIERHFIRDMRGNLRKFSMQGFRCVSCNESMRRPPLTGVCLSCKGKIIFTIHEGGIKKYLQPAIDLTNKYHLSPYIKQTIELTKDYIDSVFGKELEQQENLRKWFE